MRLTKKLLLSIMFSITVLLMIIITNLVGLQKSALLAQEQTDLDEKLTSTFILLEQIINDHIEISKLTANTKVVREFSLEYDLEDMETVSLAHEQLKIVYDAISDYANNVLHFRDGVINLDAQDGFYMRDHKSAQLWPKTLAKGNNVAVNPVFKAPLNGKPIIGVAARDSFNKEHITGVTVAINLQKFLNATLYSDRFVTESEILLIDHVGNIVGAKDETFIYSDEMKSAYEPVMEALINSDEMIEASIRGKDYYFRSLWVDYLEIYIVVQKDTSIINSRISQAILNVLPLSIVSVFAVGIVLVLFARHFTKPLTGIISEVNMIESTDYNRHIAESYVHRADEVGDLGRAINKMAMRIHDDIQTINDYNKNLENIVSQRTDALNASNMELSTSMKALENKQVELVELNMELEKSLQKVKKTQSALIESEKIASLNFLANRIAHELNTPIGNNVTLISYLKNKLEKIRGQKEIDSLKIKDFNEYLTHTEETLDMIESNLMNASGKIEKLKLLAVGNSYSIKTNIHMQEFLIDLFKRTLEDSKQQDIQFEIICNEDLIIESYHNHLVQIFYNLIMNSVQHAFIDQDMKRIHVKVENRASKLYIEYNDNGIGVVDNQISRILEPFFTTSNEPSAKGLGLSIMYNVVTKVFDGTVVPEQLENEGLAFKIELNLR